MVLMRWAVLSIVIVVTSHAGPCLSTIKPEAHAQPRHANPVAFKLTDPLSRRYRSALREAALAPANFSGDHVLAQIGCGAGCIRIAAIDRQSGRVSWFPATISGWPLAVTNPLQFDRNSPILIVQGMLDERGPSTTRRYRFDGRRFQPLKRR